MPPPFGPDHAGRPRGPPPFVVQLLRAPLTLNNIIALAITVSVHRSRTASVPVERQGCGFMRQDAAFGVLGMLFAFSTVHNFLTVMRFHRIRRSVFGESICAARRRWRQRGEVTLDDEEIKARREKFRQMCQRLPSAIISTLDIILGTVFLGLYVLTTLIAKKEDKVTLGVAYATIGALVASVLNLLVGINGMKAWARMTKKQTQRQSEHEASDAIEEKDRLLAA